MPKTSRPIQVHPITLRQVEVARVEDVTPGMRRVTLVGDQLGEFVSANGLAQPKFNSEGFDDDIRLFPSLSGSAQPALPEQTESGLKWSKEARSAYRVYSVRKWNKITGELDIDFVKHGVGLATTWAYRAQPGDHIHFFGPASSGAMPSADWLLVAGDETALPAIGRLLEELPESTKAQVFIEIADESHRQQLRVLPGVDVTWLSREGAAPGTSTLLLDAVRGAAWEEGQPFAWVAGESRAVRDIRRYLVEERAVPKSDIEFTGYWKRSEVIALDSDAELPDPERNTSVGETFHDLSELVPPIAIRVAIGLNLGEYISRGVTDVASLAERTESDPRALGKLLRYLQSINLLSSPAAEHYELTELGEFLVNDFWAEMLNPHGAIGRREAGIYGLATSIRTGEAAYKAVTGESFAQVRAESSFVSQHLEQTALAAEYLAGPLATSPVLSDIRHLVIRSAGAVVEAREITAKHPDMRVTISVPAHDAAWMRQDLPLSIPDQTQRERITIVEQSLLDPAPAADAALVVHALGTLPDADASMALTAAALNLNDTGRILLIERTLDSESLDEHEGEDDLIALTRDGTGLRTETELVTVIEAAGMRITGLRRFGWDETLREISR